MPEAGDQVIVHDPDRLHERITDGGADKVEAPGLEIFAHGLRFAGFGWDFFHIGPRVLPLLSAGKLPDITVEAAELFLHIQKGFRIAYRRPYLKTVADDPGIVQQFLDLVRIKARNLRWLEPVESLAVGITLVQNGRPA